MAEIINGLEISKSIKLEVKEKLEAYYKEGKRSAKLSVVIVGNDPASHTYVRNIAKTMEANNLAYSFSKPNSSVILSMSFSLPILELSSSAEYNKCHNWYAVCFSKSTPCNSASKCKISVL